MNLDAILDNLMGSTKAPPKGLEETSSPSLITAESVDPYEDVDAIKARVKQHIDQTDRLRWAFERLWFRSVLYELGNQWLTWDARSRRWREKKLRKWVPRPVTNRYSSTCATIVSAIQSLKVAPSAWPATDDSDDIAAADVADRLFPVIEEEIDIASKRAMVARWMVLNGDCFVLPFYDKNDKSLGETSIQSLRCDYCQGVEQPLAFEHGCPHCNQPSTTSPAFDDTQQPIVEKYPVGRMKLEVFSPLEIYLNLDITDPSAHNHFTAFKTYTLETIKTRWPENGEKVNADSQSATRTAKYFIEALSYSTEDSGYNLTGAAVRDRATVFTHFEMPSKDFPDGLYVVMSADEIILEVGPSPFFELKEDETKEYFWPLEKFPYSQVPGRLYGKTPAFDLLNKQDQLNRLESLIELATMRGTYGVWLLPAGSSISNVSGEPGLKIRWTPSGTGGAKPEVVTTSNVPPYILEWKKMIEADFEEIGGTFDAVKGNVPRGVSAGYAIQLLTERSYGRFASVFENWEAGWVGVYKKLLKLFRTYATEERVAKIKGATGKWEVEKFSRASFKGSVDIRVEGGSSRPRSKLAEQALVETLLKTGVLNPADPEQKYAIAEMFGMGKVLGAQDDDQRAAAKEWDEFLKWDGQQSDAEGNILGPQVRIHVDNHFAHISDHRKRAMSDDFFAQPKAKQLAWEQHLADHLKLLQPPPIENQSKPGPTKEGKGKEVGDQTMNQLRQGGSSTLGSGGENQHG